MSRILGPPFPEREHYGCVNCGSINHTTGDKDWCPAERNEPPSICGDCGAPIERHRGNWAKRVFGEHNGFDYCCRVTYELNGDRPMLLTADYHYVEGETQRHFPSYPEPQFPHG